MELLDPILFRPSDRPVSVIEPALMTSAALEWLIGAMGIKKGSRTVRKRIALTERVREIHAQCYLNPLDRVEEKEAELLVEQVEIDGVAELGAPLELLAADGLGGIIRVRNELLKRLPIRSEAPITDALEMEDRLGLICYHQTTIHK